MFYSFLNKLRIKHKLIILFIPMFILVMLIMALSTFYLFGNELKKNAENQVELSAEQIGKNIDLYLLNLDNASQILSFDTDFQELIKIDIERQDEDKKNIYRDKIKKFLINTLQYNMDINGIYIKNQYNNIMCWKLDNILQFDKTYERFLKIQNEVHLKKGGVVWTFDEIKDGKITLSREIYELSTMNLLGTIIIDVNDWFLDDIFDNIKNNNQFLFIILNSDGNKVISNKSNISYIDSIDNLNYITNEPLNKSSITINERKYLYTSYRCEFSQWQVIGLVDNELLFKQSNRLKLVIVFISGICIIITSFLIVLVSNSISNPISRLIKMMKDIKDGDLNNRIVINTNDEFAELGNVFNDMISEIQGLVKTLYSKELLIKEAELKSLQAQINPHFLYNTLESISCLVDLNRGDDIKRVVLSLSSLMRIAISDKKKMLTVIEEKNYLESYLFIQKIRYGDKLQYNIDIEPELFKYKIPKLINQPIVENSIIHGVERKRGIGYITVSGSIRDNKMLFVIKDNGVGFEQSLVENILNSEREAYKNAPGIGNKIGLRNIQQRIRMLYGNEFGLTIFSKPNCGTKIEVLLPIMGDEGEKTC